MKIEILYEDKNIVAINKPAGLVVHADGKTKEPTLADWILEHYPDMKDVGEPWVNPQGQTIYRPGIVHRIDRETSGVLIIAKTQDTFDLLKRKFGEREVDKIYNAFVWGELKEPEGILKDPIGRSKKDFRQWSSEPTARGEKRDAITEYKVLEKKNGFSFIEVHPKTGRTHQIRVHFKGINYPLVHDSLYAPKRESALGFTRMALHARSISFTDIDNKPHIIEAPLPEDFKRALEIMKKEQ